METIKLMVDKIKEKLSNKTLDDTQRTYFLGKLSGLLDALTLME